MAGQTKGMKCITVNQVCEIVCHYTKKKSLGRIHLLSVLQWNISNVELQLMKKNQFLFLLAAKTTGFSS